MTTVAIPASTSNLGPGFDTLGLAVNRYLEVSFEPADRVEITITGYGEHTLPRDGKNLVAATAADLLRKHGKPFHGLRLHVVNGIPDHGGLGSSGAAIAAGVVIADRIGTLGLSMQDMLTIATKTEGHPDNVTAGLLGGLTVSSFDGTMLRTRSVKSPGLLTLVCALPALKLPTAEARRMLPSTISFSAAVHNIQNVASLVSGLTAGDFSVLRWATSDFIHERYRAPLIRGYAAVKSAAIEAGALSVIISGAGPSLIAFATGNAARIGAAMKDAFRQNGVTADIEELAIENNGVAVRN